MKIKDIGNALKGFWDRLGEVDCPDEDYKDNPEMEALFKESEKNVAGLVEKYTKTTNSNKAGKGGKSGKVVETVVIDPKAMKELADKMNEERVEKEEEKTR